MNMFIDCEFNGGGGKLLSMAIVADDGCEFYEVIECNDPIIPWVQDNVMPILNKDPIPEYVFKNKLWNFLMWYDKINLIADWPDDIKYFLDSVILGPGKMMSMASFTCEIRRDISSYESALPHNALEDARAIRIQYNKSNENYYDNPFDDTTS